MVRVLVGALVPFTLLKVGCTAPDAASTVGVAVVRTGLVFTACTVVEVCTPTATAQITIKTATNTWFDILDNFVDG